MAAIHRPKNFCKNPACGNTLFVADYDYLEGEFKSVWKCTNCNWVQNRQQRNRKTNSQRAFDLYLVIRKEWKEIDDQLFVLVDSGTPSGCLLVHSSLNNWHLGKLSGTEKLSNFDVRYHASQARKELEKAKDFVKSTGAR